MITAEQIQTLDDRALKWYRKHVTQFHQECVQFEKCYKGDPQNVFHEHFKKLEKLLTDELERRSRYHEQLEEIPWFMEYGAVVEADSMLSKQS